MDNKQNKLVQIGRAIFVIFSDNEDCPLQLDIDCEECHLSSVCDMVISLEKEISTEKGGIT